MISADKQPSAGALPEPKQFGDFLTADTAVINDHDASRDADRNATVIQDKYTYWLQGYPSKHKNTEETVKRLNDSYDHMVNPNMSIPIIQASSKPHGKNWE